MSTTETQPHLSLTPTEAPRPNSKTCLRPAHVVGNNQFLLRTLLCCEVVLLFYPGPTMSSGEENYENCARHVPLKKTPNPFRSLPIKFNQSTTCYENYGMLESI